MKKPSPSQKWLHQILESLEIPIAKVIDPATSRICTQKAAQAAHDLSPDVSTALYQLLFDIKCQTPKPNVSPVAFVNYSKVVDPNPSQKQLRSTLIDLGAYLPEVTDEIATGRINLGLAAIKCHQMLPDLTIPVLMKIFKDQCQSPQAMTPHMINAAKYPDAFEARRQESLIMVINAFHLQPAKYANIDGRVCPIQMAYAARTNRVMSNWTMEDYIQVFQEAGYLCIHPLTPINETEEPLRRKRAIMEPPIIQLNQLVLDEMD